MKFLQAAFDPEIAGEFAEEISSYDFLGIPLFEADSFWNLLIRFFFNLLICWIVVHFFYYKKSKRSDYYFTFMLFSATIFLLLFLLQNLSIEIGFALGLFAIFGMIRYRTETVPIREMTYLFEIIGLSIINGFGMTASYADLLLTNVLVLAVNFVLEKCRFFNRNASKIILYEKIELIKPQNYQLLLDDLRNRTGLDIVKAEVGHINFLKDTAYVKITYKTDGNNLNSIDKMTKYKETGL